MGRADNALNLLEVEAPLQGAVILLVGNLIAALLTGLHVIANIRRREKGKKS